MCAGYTERDGGRLYSSAVCVHGDGILGRRRKVHLPPGERIALNAGGGLAAFYTPAGRIGMLPCYAKLFPEAVRALALDGALRFLGGAKVVDPDGVVLARTHSRPGLAIANADLEEIDRSLAAIDHLADRRPGAYGDPLASRPADVRDRRRIRSI